jgi:hypothetical protein
MKALVECLIDWLHGSPGDAKAWQILKALARETLKVADHPDAEQREFDALELAQACEPTRTWDYDSAKRWIQNAKLPQFVSARRGEIEANFRKCGYTEALTVDQRSTPGRHRAQWFLRSYELPPQDDGGLAEVDEPNRTATAGAHGAGQLTYEFTPPGEVKPSWLGKALLGDGSFRTWSMRGVLWATLMLGSVLVLAFFAFVFLAMTRIAKPVTTADLVVVVTLLASGWIFWRLLVRPWVWLVEDRIVPAGDVLCRWEEEPAQVELAKQGEYRYLRLVRYSGVCPTCAGRIELRYGQAQYRRRLFGCCTEAPQEHVYTFDRVTRLGRAFQEERRP